MMRKKEYIVEENASELPKNDFVENKETCKKCKGKGRGILVFFLTLLLIISMAGFAWAFMSYKNSENKVAELSSATGQQELAKKETEDLVLKVSKHLVLPQDEQPTVASIVDAVALAKDQPFYKDAHNGDKVLIYVKAQKAIVYDEIRDILVNVGPVYIENQNQQKAPAPVQPEPKTAPLTLEIRNGSKTVGAANELKSQLSPDPLYSVIKSANAKVNTYKDNVIVNLKGKDLTALAKKINATIITALPTDELPSDADAVIILGN